MNQTFYIQLDCLWHKSHTIGLCGLCIQGCISSSPLVVTCGDCNSVAVVAPKDWCCSKECLFHVPTAIYQIINVIIYCVFLIALNTYSVYSYPSQPAQSFGSFAIIPLIRDHINLLVLRRQEEPGETNSQNTRKIGWKIKRK